MYKYRLGLRSDKWHLSQLQSVQITLRNTLNASCVGDLDLVYISYTLFAGELYVIFFFWICKFWVIIAKGAED